MRASKTNEDSNSEDEEKKELPICFFKDEIIEKIRNHSVVIISGNTGSGKSTKVPQFIYDDAIKNGEKCNILISQPRKIAAMSIARRVAMERNCELGKLVGYQVGLNKKVDTENHETKILFCTTGCVLEKLIHDKGMSKYTHILLDEIHEREIDTDLLLTIIREFLLDDTSDTKLILMSATLDPKPFMKYFTLQFPEKESMPALIAMETQRDFKIDVKYLDHLSVLKISDKIINYNLPSISSEMFSVAAKLIILFLRKSTKSILVFLPGIYEIESLHAILEKCEDLNEKCLICFLHSSLPAEEQKQVFLRATLPKVVLSTNIAESSVTIPDIGCVIDLCLTKNIVSSESSLASLKLEWTTKQSSIQRAGRTGRVCDGKVYRLVHQRFYEKGMYSSTIPEMERAPLENVVLRVKLLNREPPVVFLSKCLNPPKIETLLNSLLKLKELGALTILDCNGIFDTNDGDLTFIGRVMAALPIDTRVSKLILLGYLYSVMDEVIIIAAGLNVKSIFKNHFSQKMENYGEKLKWANGSSCDLIAILNAYKYWQSECERGNLRNWKDEQQWCSKNNLERKSLREMRTLIFEIYNRLKGIGLEPLSGAHKLNWNAKEKQLIIKICIAGAFIPNFFIQGKSDEDNERDAHKILCGLDPNRTVYFRKMDRKCVGEVYVGQIKENLKELGITDASTDVNISFDSSKILVEFVNSDVMIDTGEYDERKLRNVSIIPGKIPQEIYKAVFYRKLKMSQNRLHTKRFTFKEDSPNTTFDLNVMYQEESEEFAIKHGLAEIVDGQFKMKESFIAEPAYCFLPSFNTKEIFGVVTHIEHLNKFYFQPKGENANVLNELENSAQNENFVVLDEPSADLLVFVLYQHVFKRAKIVKTFKHSKIADCFLFDYGSTIEVAYSEIYELNDEQRALYFSISERCFECTLTEISPSYIKCPRGKWTLDAIEDFRQLALSRFSKIVIYSFVNEKASVTLITDDDINVNDALIEKGYAKKCKESYVSRMNHSERENVQMSASENQKKWIPREIEFKTKVNKMLKITVPSPPMNKCRKALKLEGPFSPLETSITEISFNRLGNIKVDSLSINCITLNCNIEESGGKLIVAAEIMKNSIDGLSLHSVSAMPAILGFAVIISMIFAPNMIFYRDPQRTHILGMRFGLGANESNAESHFYAHDCILPVDFNLNSDDVREINNLRFEMSNLLQVVDDPENDAEETEKLELMTSIKRTILKIIAKNRRPQHDSSSNFTKYFANTMNSKWITDDQSDMMTVTEDPSTAFQPINFPPLYIN